MTIVILLHDLGYRKVDSTWALQKMRDSGRTCQIRILESPPLPPLRRGFLKNIVTGDERRLF